ncbi:MAG TPA: hypothetical protein VGH28_34065 [Polyangiaceae bacterium]|jgi:hypothetical protein
MPRTVFLFIASLVLACSSVAPDDGDAGLAPDAASTQDAPSQNDGSTPADAAGDAPVTSNGLSIVTSFEGDVDEPGAGCNGACAYRNHPDMGIAVNGTQVVEVSGQNLSVFDYSGKVLKQTAFGTFMTSMGLSVSTIADPRMTYDPFISKWIVVCSCSNDYVMVSDTSDATGGWTGLALGVSSGDLTMWPGWDKNGVYVSEFQAGSAAPYPYAVVALDNSLQQKGVFKNFPYESRPAMDPNKNKKATDPEYFVARGGPTQNGTNVTFNVLVDAIQWNGATPKQLAQATVASPYLYNTPVDVAQPSGPAVKAQESHRAFASVVENGHLHTVIGSGPQSGVDKNQLFFWFDIDLSNMSLAQSAKVSSATEGYLFPSLAVDSMGNVAMIATSVGPSTNPSVVAFAHQTTDPSGFVSAPLVVAKGTSPFTCISTNPVGWGTYTNAFQDPSDPTKVWAVEEYSASSTDCQWHTRVVELTP